MRSLFPSWPRRRWVAAGILLPVTALWFARIGAGVPGSLAAPGLAWIGPVALASALAALVLSSYVPPAGWRPEVGCTPCAALSGLTLVGATIALRSAPLDPANAALAVLMLSFGLYQRLSAPASCEVPAGPAVGPGRDVPAPETDPASSARG